MAGRDNPWQAATRLGKRLRVEADHGEREHGDVWGIAQFHHPDTPLTYRISVEGDTAGWEVRSYSWNGHATVEKSGTMDPATAMQYVHTAKMAEPRRLAAWQMLNRLAGATS